MVSLTWLQGDGLLTDDDLAPAADFPHDHVDYERVTPFRMEMLRRAFDRVENQGSPSLLADFEEATVFGLGCE